MAGCSEPDGSVADESLEHLVREAHHFLDTTSPERDFVALGRRFATMGTHRQIRQIAFALAWHDRYGVRFRSG